MEYTKSCLNCGTEFKTGSKLSLYHSEACRKAYSRRTEPSSEAKTHAGNPDKPGIVIDTVRNMTQEDADKILEESVKKKFIPGTEQGADIPVDLSKFISFQDGLALFIKIIRNKSSKEVKEKNLAKLREAAGLHPSLSPNQFYAITDRIRYYLTGEYSEKFIPNLHGIK